MQQKSLLIYTYQTYQTNQTNQTCKMHRKVAGPVICAMIVTGAVLYVVGQILTQELAIQSQEKDPSKFNADHLALFRASVWCTRLSYLMFILTALIGLLCLCGGCGSTTHMSDDAGQLGDDVDLDDDFDEL